MRLRNISIILIIITLLPAVFYLVYEFTSLNENERLLDAIVDEQLDFISARINRYSWEGASHWAESIPDCGVQPNEEEIDRMFEFLRQNTAIRGFVVSDTAGVHPFSIIPDTSDADINISGFSRFIAENHNLVNRLVYRKNVGYTKIEPIFISRSRSSSDSSLVLLFANKSQSMMTLNFLILNPDLFIRQLLVPAIQEFPESDAVLGIFRTGQQQPMYQTGEINWKTMRVSRKIWLFPDHVMGFRISGVDVHDMARSRFRRSVVLVIFLDLVLIAGAVLLYNNFKAEHRLSRMKSDFVSNVSHELRTPIASIRMYAETLSMDRVPTEERKQKYYQIIAAESERLTHLINNILDFAKIESRRKEYRFKLQDLNALIRNVAEMYEYRIVDMQFNLEMELCSQPLEVNADADAIEEALINLLENAVKYSTDDRRIFIRSGEIDQWKFVEIEDRGMGIPASEHKRIFEKFYRISTGLVHNTKGSGLGLTLVQYTMKAHQGYIELDSTPGIGSRFRLLFPGK